MRVRATGRVRVTITIRVKVKLRLRIRIMVRVGLGLGLWLGVRSGLGSPLIIRIYGQGSVENRRNNNKSVLYENQIFSTFEPTLLAHFFSRI